MVAWYIQNISFGYAIDTWRIREGKGKEYELERDGLYGLYFWVGIVLEWPDQKVCGIGYLAYAFG